MINLIPLVSRDAIYNPVNVAIYTNSFGSSRRWVDMGYTPPSDFEGFFIGAGVRMVRIRETPNDAFEESSSVRSLEIGFIIPKSTYDSLPTFEASTAISNSGTTPTGSLILLNTGRGSGNRRAEAKIFLAKNAAGSLVYVLWVNRDTPSGSNYYFTRVEGLASGQSNLGNKWRIFTI